MDAGGDLGSAAKGSAITLEVAGSDLVSCYSSPSSFFAMCSSLSCLSFIPPYITRTSNGQRVSSLTTDSGSNVGEKMFGLIVLWLLGFSA